MCELVGAEPSYHAARQRYSERLVLDSPRRQRVEWRVVRIVKVAMLQPNVASPHEPWRDREWNGIVRAEGSNQTSAGARRAQRSVVVAGHQGYRIASTEMSPQGGSQAGFAPEHRPRGAQSIRRAGIGRQGERVAVENDLVAGVRAQHGLEVTAKPRAPARRKVQVTRDQEGTSEHGSHLAQFQRIGSGCGR